ncbi:exodeoxyribonuclease V subunit alpha [Geomonas sp. Red32]|uniref:exodeoxyribonuclease V subunit alpha n=1 Tax=Geomonas sp. Red32 TaxID=2912856 RepID=UPI00202CBD0F|nr:exodeoxyribonuclease V subunit alpha [Geomonas sp. Red32]MCM0083532.1 exodeoxyribonuclease V subunit alpha [Geomonas sp. Red32]
MTISFQLNPTDRHFADFLQRQGGGSSPLFSLASSLVSNAVVGGNVCLDLADIAGTTIEVDAAHVSLPPLEEIKAALLKSPCVTAAGEFRPLVLDGDRLYLYRYWRYERDLVRVLLHRSAPAPGDLDLPLLRAGVERLFGSARAGETDWQKVAALAALWKPLTVVSGGPGTGKTSTVIKILALLLEQAKGGHLRIALTAPTGKAAARLKDSIRGMKERLDCSSEIRNLIPEEVTTIHRLLGVRGGSLRFRHDADNPLPHDVVIVDEASMVAMPLMARLAIALRPATRLILLGDRDQLASVEAGAVLGDICGGGRSEPFSAAFSAFVREVGGEELPVPVAQGEDVTASVTGTEIPLADSLVVLKRNYRFGADSGIGAAARAVNGGEGIRALEILTGDEFGEVEWQDMPAPERLKKALAAKVEEGYAPYLAAPAPGDALRLFDRFRLLCALRNGPAGVAGVNEIVEEILAEKGLIDRSSRWYRGRPVMITVNDYNLKLFNGDIGIVLPDPDSDGMPRVWFPAPDGGVRKVSPARLPEHETVFAMTVHKSQGSEFESVLMLLPGHESETLTRELIYTGITRARSRAAIWGEKPVFLEGVSRRVERTSGLRKALWKDDGE